MSGEIFGCPRVGGGGMLLVSRGQRPGILLYIIQHAGQLSLQQRITQFKMSVALRLRNPGIGGQSR